MGIVATVKRLGDFQRCVDGFISRLEDLSSSSSPTESAETIAEFVRCVKEERELLRAEMEATRTGLLAAASDLQTALQKARDKLAEASSLQNRAKASRCSTPQRLRKRPTQDRRQS